jgi:hypothetical protein
MEPMDEETERQESSCGGSGPVGWTGPQRGQTAGQPGKWPQGRFGQKPQEENRRPSQRATSAARSPEKLIEIVIATICARFGDCAIGRGDRGTRFVGGRELKHQDGIGLSLFRLLGFFNKVG